MADINAELWRPLTALVDFIRGMRVFACMRVYVMVMHVCLSNCAYMYEFVYVFMCKECM